MENITIPNLVLAAVTDDPEPYDYQHHLARKISDFALNATLLIRFHTDIRRLLVHPARRG